MAGVTVNLAPIFNGWQGFTPGGLPLNGGQIFTYQAGTTTPYATYTTSAGAVQNANPIILGSDGRPPNEIWLVAGIAYKFVLEDSLSNVIATYDNLIGINDTSALPVESEWVPSGLSPTFVNTTSFTVPGDQSASGSGFFTAKRRIRVVETAGTVYGVVTSSSVSASITTVNVTIDSGGVIDSGISAVSYGLLGSINPSIPQYITAGTNAAVTYTAGVPTISVTLTTIVPRSYLAGCTLSTAGGSGTMSVAAGQAVDSTNAISISVAAISKTTAAWVAGTGNGGLDTGSITTATWYHFYAISNTLGSLVDVIFSLNATTPALPSGYTLFRRIGSGLTDGSSHWTAFIQQGDFFELVTPVLESTSATPGTSAVTQTLANVPTGINERAFLNVVVSAAGNAVYISDLATADAAASSTVAPGLSVGTNNSTGSAAQVTVRTNTSAQIRTRNIANGQTFITTLGWFDRRGQDN